MGTDIHYWAEHKTDAGWVPCYSDQLNSDGERSLLDFYCGEEWNYILFAILAGVQRVTNGGFESIVPSRGLPSDSPLCQGATPDDGGYYHNASWLTLKELLDFAWYEKKREFNGSVTAEQYQIFKTPEQYPLFSEGGRVVSNQEMERLIQQGDDTEGVLTLISFSVPYADFAGPFLTETLPLLGRQGEPENVRLVFYFDS